MNSILFALESFFPSHRAGTEIYVFNLCRYFINKSWKVRVLIATTSHEEAYTYRGILVETFKIPKKPNTDELNGIKPPSGIREFLTKVQEYNPDIVHFHSFGRAINSNHLEGVKKLGIKTAFTPHLGSIFCVKGNLRLFENHNCDGKIIESRCLKCLIHSKGFHPLMSKLMGEVVLKTTKINGLSQKVPPAFKQVMHRKAEISNIDNYADLIFSIAPWIKIAFELNEVKSSILLPQGISPIFFDNSLIDIKKNNARTINFCFIGRMHPSKGFHHLKKVWDKIDIKNHKLHVISNPSGGEHDYFKHNKEWCLREKNVIWNEGLTQKEVAVYLNSIDVLILPSVSNEVAPLVILEAATRKIPVIASDYIAMKYMVTHEVDGLLFRNEDVIDLEKQIMTLADNYKLINQYSQQIQSPVSINEVAEIIEEEYKKIL